MTERLEDESRQQYRQEVNEAKRAKLREIEVTMLCYRCLLLVLLLFDYV